MKCNVLETIFMFSVVFKTNLMFINVFGTNIRSRTTLSPKKIYLGNEFRFTKFLSLVYPGPTSLEPILGPSTVYWIDYWVLSAKISFERIPGPVTSLDRIPIPETSLERILCPATSLEQFPGSKRLRNESHVQQSIINFFNTRPAIS